MTAAVCPWSSYDPATIRFCEERLCAWIAEPANAWSNLAFVLVGVVIVAVARNHEQPLRLVGVGAVGVGLGSFAFHATGTFWGEVLDLVSMFILSALFLTFTLRRVLGWTAGKMCGFFALLVASSTAVLIGVRPSGIPLFALQVTIWIGLEWRWRKRPLPGADHRELRRLVVTFAAAFVIWALDLSGIVCDPTNHSWNGHATWHLLDALCLGWFFRYQRQFFAAADVRR